MAGKVSLLSSFLLVGLFLIFCSAEQLPKNTAQSVSAMSSFQITVPAESGFAMRAAERLQSYIEKNSGQTPRIEQKSIIHNELEQKAAVVIGTDSSFTNLNDFELADDFAKISGEGYILKTVAKNGSDYIFALGKTERGASNAVWHLMRKLDVKDGKVTAPALSVVRMPFIKGREVTFCWPWARAGLGVADMQKLLVEKYWPPCWSEDRLRRNMDLLDSFGYNSIELGDVWFFVDPLKKFGIERTALADKIKTVADELHKNGQTFSLFVYSSATKDFKTGKEFAVPGACWNDPCEREVLLTEYDYQANTYGSYTDRIVTHWADHGGQPGCKKCTINTALEQHNIILEKFRAKNLNVQSAFSLWHIRTDLWPGYKNDDSILGAGILSKDVSISIPRRFDLKRARHIIEKGYNPSVWCWGSLDIELWQGLHVHTKFLEDYFKSIPSDVADKLEFHTVDNISQFLILSNLYVAGQLMWNPNQSGSDLLREYMRGTFGAENAETMTFVYEAIEKGGCCFCPDINAPSSRHPNLAKALEGASEERLAMLMKAKTQLAKVKISPDFVPVFPSIIEPEELLKEIDAQLFAMIKYADFQLQAKKLMTSYPELMSAADTEGIKRAFEALPKVPAPKEYLWVNAFARYWIDNNALSKELKISGN